MNASSKANKPPLDLSAQSTLRLLIVILAVSVISRMAAAVFLGNQVEIMPGTHDQLSYHTLALRFLDGHGFTFGEAWWPLTQADAPTAHWSFLYTFYLIAVYGIFGPNPLAARILQAVIVGLLQPYLIYRIGKYIFNDLIGIISAAITALYIYFIYYAANLMTESFYITAILGSLYLAIRLATTQENKRWQVALLFGVVTAATVLLRQVYLLFLPFLFLWIWWSARKHKLASTFPMLVASGLIIIAAILPFSLYNYARFDRFVFIEYQLRLCLLLGEPPNLRHPFRVDLAAGNGNLPGFDPGGVVRPG